MAALGVQNNEMEKLIKRMEFYLDNSSVFHECECPHNAVVDLRIYMGIDRIMGDPVFMVKDDRIIPHLYGYFDKSGNRAEAVFLDVDGDGRVDTFLPRGLLDVFVDTHRASPTGEPSLQKDGTGQECIALVDVTAIASMCVFVKRTSECTVPEGCIVSDDDPSFEGKMYMLPIRGFFVPMDPMRALEEEAKKAKKAALGAHTKTKKDKLFPIKDIPKCVWLQNMVLLTDVFGKFDSSITNAIAAIHEEMKQQEEKVALANQRATLENSICIERERERKTMLAQTREQRVKREEAALVTREAAILAQKKRGQAKKATPACTKKFTAKDICEKQSSIEKARQHDIDLKEREERRVSELQERLRMVQIGDSIVRGD